LSWDAWRRKKMAFEFHSVSKRQKEKPMCPKRRWNDQGGTIQNGLSAVRSGSPSPKLITTPLGWLARMAREAGYRARVALSVPTIEQSIEIERERIYAEQRRLAEEYSHGYLEGWHECYSACLNAVEEEFSTKGDIWSAGDLFVRPESSLKTN
jgi:hypothetical protein